MRSSIFVSIVAASLAAGVSARAQTAPARAAGVYRALLVGIDAYAHVTPLKGSVADIHDLESSLRGIGATDIKVLLDGAATRGSVLAEFNAMALRANPGDTIFLSVSGHGAQEPERVRGSAVDGMDTVFLLAGFDPNNDARYGEKIVDKEFNHFVKMVEDRGARVVFIADTCSGGGLARDVDPRAEEMSYRAIRYKPREDTLTPVSTRAEAFMSPTDFKASNFLAAVDRQSKSPEIKVPGLGYRGALSYAVARGLEGAADLNNDGVITTAELFDYTTRVTYQLSDQRQKIVTAAAQGVNPVSDVIVRFDRGIAVRPPEPEKPGPAVTPPPPGPGPTSAGTRPGPANPPPGPAATPAVANAPPPVAKPAVVNAPTAAAAGLVRVASLDGQSNRLSGLSLQTKIELVAPTANPDIVWDPASKDVLTGGDIIARNIDRNDLPGVIERTSAVRQVKARALRSPQAIRVVPDDRLHRKGTRVEIEVSGLVGKSLIMFNLAGDGTVQMIYPIGSDPVVRSEPVYRVPLIVRDPLGSDEIVAITSSRRLPELEAAIKGLDRRRNPVKISELLNQFAGADVSVGSAGLFTAP